MLAYMEEKYGETFTEQEAYAGQFGKDYTMLKVRSRSRPGEDILVRSLQTGVTVYQDNYLARLLRSEIEEKMAALAEPVFGECKVFYKIPELVFPPDFPADMTAEAFLRHPLSMVRIYVYVKSVPEDPQKLFQDFYASLRERGYFAGGVVSFAADEKSYCMITGENFVEDIYRGYESAAELIFSMDEEGNLRTLRQTGRGSD